jgi:hypothetical protein
MNMRSEYLSHFVPLPLMNRSNFALMNPPFFNSLLLEQQCLSISPEYTKIGGSSQTVRHRRHCLRTFKLTLPRPHEESPQKKAAYSRSIVPQSAKFFRLSKSGMDPFMPAAFAVQTRIAGNAGINTILS